jgi:hypothetical protein
MTVGPEQEATQPAAKAWLAAPQGLAFDSKGDLYVADAGSGIVRKVTGLDGTTPTISRFAGVSSLEAFAVGATVGEGRDAPVIMPFSVAVDARDNVYVGELGSVGMAYLIAGPDDVSQELMKVYATTYARVRRFAPDGKVTTIAGPGGRIFTDPLATDGLVMPMGLAIAPDGRLAIADRGANLVRVLPQSALE